MMLPCGQNDAGGFEPYTDNVNLLLEAGHDAYLANNAPAAHELVTPEIIRFVDDRPQTYKVNFAHMTQTNTSTGYKRKVARKLVDVPALAVGGVQPVWEYIGDDGSFQRNDLPVPGSESVSCVNWSADGSLLAMGQFFFPPPTF